MKKLFCIFCIAVALVSCNQAEDSGDGGSAGGGNQNNKTKIDELDCGTYVFFLAIDDASKSDTAQFFKILGSVMSGFGTPTFVNFTDKSNANTPTTEVMVTVAGNPSMVNEQQASLELLAKLDDVSGQCSGQLNP